MNRQKRGTPIKVWVPGTPKAWPRPVPLIKRNRALVRCSDKNGCRVKVVPGAVDREWRRAIVARVGMLVGLQAPWFSEGEPLLMAARFHFERPQAHHVANDRTRPLKTNAPGREEIVKRPDC